jgi:hypothetical protein
MIDSILLRVHQSELHSSLILSLDLISKLTRMYESIIICRFHVKIVFKAPKFYIICIKPENVDCLKSSKVVVISAETPHTEWLGLWEQTWSSAALNSSNCSLSTASKQCHSTSNPSQTLAWLP